MQIVYFMTIKEEKAATRPASGHAANTRNEV